MLVPILPFFLAARIAVDQGAHPRSQWQQYGPECTYQVLVNMSLSNIVHEDDNFCSMIASELRCRPVGSDTLTCRFLNGHITRPDPEQSRCTNARDFVPVTTKFVTADPFEIRFNPRGIENLVVSRNIPRWRLDMIKAIVGQLNVGFEYEERRQRYATMENSTIGYCEVEIKVGRAGYGAQRLATNFEIVLEPERADVIPLSRGSLVIYKNRPPKKCPRKAVYFFGNHRDFSAGNKDVYMDMTSSNSYMMIGKNQFHSYTEVQGVMRTTKRQALETHRLCTIPKARTRQPSSPPALQASHRREERSKKRRRIIEDHERKISVVAALVIDRRSHRCRRRDWGLKSGECIGGIGCFRYGAGAKLRLSDSTERVRGM
ncbi:hypothetical protein KM043_000681 [Ampulex compressa]|nr:hypothetical protein KM043_000681 [Ampulex compressa]